MSILILNVNMIIQFAYERSHHISNTAWEMLLSSSLHNVGISFCQRRGTKKWKLEIYDMVCSVFCDDIFIWHDMQCILWWHIHMTWYMTWYAVHSMMTYTYIYMCVYVYRRVYTEGRNQVKMYHAMSSMLGFLPQFLYPIYIHSSKYSINNTLNSTRSDKSYNLKE